MIIGQHALAHQRMADGDLHVIDEIAQFIIGLRECNAAAHMNDRRLRVGQMRHDLAGRVIVQ